MFNISIKGGYVRGALGANIHIGTLGPRQIHIPTWTLRCSEAVIMFIASICPMTILQI